MRQMSDHSERTPTPIYTPIEFISFEQWASSIHIRHERVQQIISPAVNREASQTLDSQAIEFAFTAVTRFDEICQTRFTNQGNPPSEIPVFCILDGEAKNGSAYNLNGVRGVHNGPTLITAQALISALCPEFGIHLTYDFQALLQKATMAQQFGYADRYDNHRNPSDSVEFSTILPGISLSISFNGQERYISRYILV